MNKICQRMILNFSMNLMSFQYVYFWCSEITMCTFRNIIQDLYFHFMWNMQTSNALLFACRNCQSAILYYDNHLICFRLGLFNLIIVDTFWNWIEIFKFRKYVFSSYIFITVCINGYILYAYVIIWKIWKRHLMACSFVLG